MYINNNKYRFGMNLIYVNIGIDGYFGVVNVFIYQVFIFN